MSPAVDKRVEASVQTHRNVVSDVLKKRFAYDAGCAVETVARYHQQREEAEETYTNNDSESDSALYLILDGGVSLEVVLSSDLLSVRTRHEEYISV